MRINAFRVELPGGSYEDLLSSAAASIEAEIAVGNAIYMLPSFYNHDCGKISHFMASSVLTVYLIAVGTPILVDGKLVPKIVFSMRKGPSSNCLFQSSIKSGDKTVFHVRVIKIIIIIIIY